MRLPLWVPCWISVAGSRTQRRSFSQPAWSRVRASEASRAATRRCPTNRSHAAGPQPGAFGTGPGLLVVDTSSAGTRDYPTGRSFAARGPSDQTPEFRALQNEFFKVRDETSGAVRVTIGLFESGGGKVRVGVPTALG